MFSRLHLMKYKDKTKILTFNILCIALFDLSKVLIRLNCTVKHSIYSIITVMQQSKLKTISTKVLMEMRWHKCLYVQSFHIDIVTYWWNCNEPSVIFQCCLSETIYFLNVHLGVRALPVQVQASKCFFFFSTWGKKEKAKASPAPPFGLRKEEPWLKGSFMKRKKYSYKE